MTSEQIQHYSETKSRAAARPLSDSESTRRKANALVSLFRPVASVLEQNQYCGVEVRVGASVERLKLAALATASKPQLVKFLRVPQVAQDLSKMQSSDERNLERLMQFGARCSEYETGFVIALGANALSIIEADKFVDETQARSQMATWKSFPSSLVMHLELSSNGVLIENSSRSQPWSAEDASLMLGPAAVKRTERFDEPLRYPTFNEVRLGIDY